MMRTCESIAFDCGGNVSLDFFGGKPGINNNTAKGGARGRSSGQRAGQPAASRGGPPQRMPHEKQAVSASLATSHTFNCTIRSYDPDAVRRCAAKPTQ
jgi:hypothetical protein